MKKVFQCIFTVLLINSLSGQETIKLDESDIVIKTSGILDSMEKIIMQFLGIKD